MNVYIVYERDKDIWCILNKGKSSNNSNTTTAQYSALIEQYGENPHITDVNQFIDAYLIQSNIDIQNEMRLIESDWSSISDEYHRRAQQIFGTELLQDITAYMTINSRCPYSIDAHMFYVVAGSPSHARKTIMHELWHFYTWYGLGAAEEQRLGAEKYNTLKESLTVLLNIECNDLLPAGLVDGGYTQHQDIRKEIIRFWEKDKNIKNLWEHLVEFVN